MTAEFFAEIALGQMTAALLTLGQSIESADGEAWEAPHPDTAVNQVVFHALFYADLYLGMSEEGFRDQGFHAAHREIFGDYEDRGERRPVRVYPKEECRAYLDFCLAKAREVLRGETDASLSRRSGFYWQEFSRAELHVYNARHIQHHAAQLGLRTQLRGGPALDWVSRG